MSSIRNRLFAVGAALMLAAPTAAQQAPVSADQLPAVSAVQVTAPVVSTWPSFDNSSLIPGVVPVAAPTLASLALLPMPVAQSSNVAMMIVGGAMMIVGSLVDGDTGTIIMVGGGAIGLVGLYRYLR